jgi:acyl-CoA synthetase (AMP-forming)/AMP-acid ligase II
VGNAVSGTDASGDGSEDHFVRGDLEWGTTARLIRDAAATWGDHPAIVQGDVTLSYSELRRRADEAAKAFMAAGIEKGDRIAIWAPNIWEWPVALLGLQAAGGVLVPLNTRYKGTEAAHILGASRARILLTVEGFLGNDYVSMLRSSGSELGHLERIVLLRGEAAEGTTSFADFLTLASEVDDDELDARVASIGPEDLSDLLFTSGTTGAPKGVMCTHGQTVRAAADWGSVAGLRSDDRYLVINPFFHSFGYKAGIVACLCAGATIHPEPVFDVPAAMASIAEHRITVLPGPPTLYLSIMGHPDFDASRLSSLRLAVTGAASVPVQLVRDMSAVLGFETVLTAYGLTEATGFVSACRPGDDPETVAHYSGRAYPGVEIEIHDEHGVGLAPDTPGEVVVRGYNVMRGYFDDPEETALAIDADGWLHTGDIGIMDDRGYLRITDRTKDMFIVGGFNAYPAEIENLMLANEAIAQVAVIGVPDDRMGEVGMAFVVLRPDVDVTADAITAWCKETMANFKVPRHVQIVETLPLNATGKVLKFELRDRAAELLGTM